MPAFIKSCDCPLTASQGIVCTACGKPWQPYDLDKPKPANLPMTPPTLWTTVIPRTPGYYWHRENLDERPVPVEIYTADNSLYLRFLAEDPVDLRLTEPILNRNNIGLWQPLTPAVTFPQL